MQNKNERFKLNYRDCEDLAIQLKCNVIFYVKSLNLLTNTSRTKIIGSELKSIRLANLANVLLLGEVLGRLQPGIDFIS